MASFSFKALDLAGVPTQGEIDAADKQTVASQLRSKGLIVLDIVEQKPTDVGDIFARFKKVKSDELTIATRQLSTMVSSGMSLLRALYVIEEQTDSDPLREAFIEVRKDVEAGVSLSEGLKRHPKIFNELYVAMVAAGETGGILDSTLIRVADQLEKDDALRRQVKAAMIYPMLIGGFALVTLFALVAFLVPVFEKVFEDFGGDLPAITKFTVMLSHLVTDKWYVLIGVTVLTISVFRRWKRSERGRVQWDRFKLKIPILGAILSKTAVARFTRTLGTLISAGVPILDAINITKETAGNEVYSRALVKVHDAIREGESMADPLRATKVCDAIVVNMIDVGEETGDLDKMLLKVADNYDNDVDVLVSSLISILEPVMVVVLGLIVGFIVIALFMPMISLIQGMSSTGGKK